MTTPFSPDPAVWEQAQEIFLRAVDVPPRERAALLDLECGGNVGLRALVEALLEGDEAADALMGGTLDGLALLAGPTGPGEGEVGFAPGDRIGSYTLLEELGRGGMGVVYRANDARLQRPVALKFLFERAGAESARLEQVLREARAFSALQHPNVATVFEVGEATLGEGGVVVPFIAMAYYEGETLAARLKRKPLTAVEVDSVALGIIRGLAAAHSVGVVHRDVKPANVILAEDGAPRLLDFGIAALGDAPHEGGAVRGTPAYMSPEQIQGEGVDAASDVWSMGVLLQEMATGERPFRGDSVQQTLGAILGGTPSPPPRGTRPAWVGPVVTRCLSGLRQDRYPHAGAMLADIERRRRSGARRVWALAAGAAAVLAAIAFVGGSRLSEPEFDGASGLDPDRSLAVAPFRALTPDAEDEALSIGVTEEVVAALAQIEGLRVLGRGSVAPHVESGTPIVEIGQALTAGFLLDGSVQRLQDRVRIAATLTDTRTEEVVWTQDYQRDLTVVDIFEVQDEVARAVARELESSLPGRRVRPTDDMTAYEHFLLGNMELARRTPTSVARAVSEYQAARELDPSFTAALGREAYAYAVIADWGWSYPGLSRPDLLALSDTLSQAALDQDSTLAESWLSRAYFTVLDDPVGQGRALPLFERAIELDPTNAESYHQYGQTLMIVGRFEEAAQAYHSVLEREPRRAMTLVPLSALSYRQRDTTAALMWADSAVAVGPDVPYAWAVRGRMRNVTGDPAGGRADGEQALRIDPSYAVPTRSLLAESFQYLGDTVSAALELERTRAAILRPDEPSATDAMYYAGALITLGRPDEALDVVERVTPRNNLLWWTLISPTFDAIRGQPRFQAIMREVDPTQGG